jgi:TldD protein
LELAEHIISCASSLGAAYTGVIFQEVLVSTITVENGVLKSYVTSAKAGVGIRVLVNGAMGIAASTSLDREAISRKLQYAVKMAKVAKVKVDPIQYIEAEIPKTSFHSNLVKPPNSISNREKIDLVIAANKTAMLEGIKNSTTRLAWFDERRVFTSSEGADVSSNVTMTGLAQSSVAEHQGSLERVSDSASRCTGFEFILENDWNRFAKNVSETAKQVVKSPAPTPGVYEVVADPKLIGLILHEAFGHASEADLVMTGESILQGAIGTEVASSLVTIIDDGIVDGGYFVPFDDEGVSKTKQKVVEQGVLKGFLHSRETGYKLHHRSTGNARVQSFEDKPIVRQTNLFMNAGDCSWSELLEDVNDGLYLCGRGARGGEVDVGLGTFTFRTGPSYIIKKGELKEMVRGVSISGMILNTLRNVDAVGKEVQIITSIFGGCGKFGQMVRVGDGGPHVKIRGMSVGSET